MSCKTVVLRSTDSTLQQQHVYQTTGFTTWNISKDRLIEDWQVSFSTGVIDKAIRNGVFSWAYALLKKVAILSTNYRPNLSQMWVTSDVHVDNNSVAMSII